MKAIILAAGKGSRISDSIGPIPKSTLEVQGKPIIRNTVEKLLEKRIQVAVCLGYRYQKIKDSLAGLPVEYYYNPFYEAMNNIGTLWFAREFLDDDCILLSADVVFDDEVLNRIINAKGDMLMVTDRTRVLDGDYFFSLDSQGSIIKYGPDIDESERSCEYVGLSRLSNRAVGAFRNMLEEMVEDGNYQCYFELVFFSFITNKEYQLCTIDISGCTWREIDRIEDYQKAVEEFNERNTQ